jgi:hypothetical protein
VRTQKTSAAAAAPISVRINWRSRYRKGSPLAWLAIEIDAEVTITRPSSTVPSVSATITGSMRMPPLRALERAKLNSVVTLALMRRAPARPARTRRRARRSP